MKKFHVSYPSSATRSILPAFEQSGHKSSSTACRTCDNLKSLENFKSHHSTTKKECVQKVYLDPDPTSFRNPSSLRHADRLTSPYLDRCRNCNKIKIYASRTTEPLGHPEGVSFPPVPPPPYGKHGLITRGKRIFSVVFVYLFLSLCSRLSLRQDLLGFRSWIRTSQKNVCFWSDLTAWGFGVQANLK